MSENASEAFKQFQIDLLFFLFDGSKYSPGGRIHRCVGNGDDGSLNSIKRGSDSKNAKTIESNTKSLGCLFGRTVVKVRRPIHFGFCKSKSDVRDKAGIAIDRNFDSSARPTRVKDRHGDASTITIDA